MSTSSIHARLFCYPSYYWSIIDDFRYPTLWICLLLCQCQVTFFLQVFQCVLIESPTTSNFFVRTDSVHSCKETTASITMILLLVFLLIIQFFTPYVMTVLYHGFILFFWVFVCYTPISEDWIKLYWYALNSTRSRIPSANSVFDKVTVKYLNLFYFSHTLNV